MQETKFVAFFQVANLQIWYNVLVLRPFRSAVGQYIILQIMVLIYVAFINIHYYIVSHG